MRFIASALLCARSGRPKRCLPGGAATPVQAHRFFSGKSSLTTWIYRITVNTCLDFLRAQSRRERILERNYEEDLTNVGDLGKHGLQVDGELDVARMYACIQRLPVLDRTLLSLYLEEASTKEMAEVMGISESNVRVKLSRIKDVLRKMLEGSNHGSR